MADAREQVPASVETGPADDAVAALVKLGVDRHVASEYVRRGDPGGAVFDTVLLSGRLERKISASAIESQGGLTAGETATLVEAFGLTPPAPTDPAFTAEEARVLVRLRELEGLWPAELRVQVARASGAMLAAIARAHVQAFQAHTEPHVRALAGGTVGQLRELRAAFEQLLPLADPLLVGVHRRWIEHELAQRVIRAAEQQAGAGDLPGAVEVTFLFCDLKDFTAYAEAAGDAAAIAAIDRFFEVVAHVRGDTGRLVKSLGDGAMLVYGDCAEAVAAGARVILGMRSSEPIRVHASVHHGVAIARSGDYFGGSVNLAARLLAFAQRDELVASEDAVRASDSAFDWKPAGERRVRGVGAPIKVYRLASVPTAAAHAPDGAARTEGPG